MLKQFKVFRNYIILDHHILLEELAHAAGEVAIVVNLDPLGEDALVKILTEPKNAIIKQYQKLVGYDGVKLTVEDEAVREIAQTAIRLKTGARGLRSILERVLLAPMFDAPDKDDLAEIVIDADVVLGKKQPVEVMKESKKAA